MTKLLITLAVILLCVLFLLAVFPDKATDTLTLRHGPPDCRPGQDCIAVTRTPFVTTTPWARNQPPKCPLSGVCP